MPLRIFSFVWHPPGPLLAIELWHGLHMLNPILQLKVGDDKQQYMLRGVLYFAAEHFTARLITQSGFVWFCDSLIGRSLVYESSNGLLAQVEIALVRSPPTIGNHAEFLPFDLLHARQTGVKFRVQLIWFSGHGHGSSKEAVIAIQTMPA